MRPSPWISVLLIGTLFVYPLTAQDATPKYVPRNPQSKPYQRDGPEQTPASPSATSVTPKTAVFLECEQDQCTHGGGGAIWVFYGRPGQYHGQAMWRYGAEAELIVDHVDDQTIVISRADPPGTYSSRWHGPDGYFRAVYTGVLSKDTIRGAVYFNGDQSHPGTWSADRNDSLCQTAEACPLTIPQILELASNARNAHQPEVAFTTFKMASNQGNADAKGYVGGMMMRGVGTQADSTQGFRLLQESANSGSYIGQTGLAGAYEEGIGISKNPEEAKRWRAKAETTKERLEAEKNAPDASDALAIGAAAILGILILGAIMGGGSGGDDASGHTASHTHSPSPYETYSRECEIDHIESSCRMIDKQPKNKDDE